MKIGVFILLVVVSYVLFWLAFRFRIRQNKSPAKAFMFFFSLYMFTVFLSVFVCFSEYALLQAYDSDLSYLSQVNWTLVLIIFFVWVPFSIGITYFLKGKS